MKALKCIVTVLHKALTYVFCFVVLILLFVILIIKAVLGLTSDFLGMLVKLCDAILDFMDMVHNKWMNHDALESFSNMIDD